MTRLVKTVGFAALLVLTWAIHVYHLGVFPPPNPANLRLTQSAPAVWIDKAKLGIHQLVLFGTPYERGLEAGRLTQDLLLRQERELNDQLATIVPSQLLVRSMVLLAIRWFYGIQDYFEPWMTEEMYGVSQSAPREYDSLLDGYTRQVAYHGLHEVGQMLVDQGGNDSGWGCTVVALPHKDTWVIGRNFDFEGGRTFDSEKIMKWVFPDRGHAYLSVIWAGMVGAVTGVNEHGLYVSLNAAGSKDVRRHGTPSTLVLLKILQFAKNAAEALEILKSSTMFITDIFVLLDSKAGTLYRIEKSPRKMEVLPQSRPMIVTNHLVSEVWSNDAVNAFRRDELTSSVRLKRGQELLEKIDRREPPVRSVLNILRDKGEIDGESLHLGNRQAIDALIATHSVVFDGSSGKFFVSSGPGVSGSFVGFDLAASFERRMPIVDGALPRDSLVSDRAFAAIRSSGRDLHLARVELLGKRCDTAKSHLNAVELKFKEQGSYYDALGDYHACVGDSATAREAWKRALALHPAYPRERRHIEEKLKQ